MALRGNGPQRSLLGSVGPKRRLCSVIRVMASAAAAANGGIMNHLDWLRAAFPGVALPQNIPTNGLALGLMCSVSPHPKTSSFGSCDS